MKPKYPTTIVLSQTKQIYIFFFTSMIYEKLRHCCLKNNKNNSLGPFMLYQKVIQELLLGGKYWL